MITPTSTVEPKPPGELLEDTLIGQHVGKFRLVRRIGQGGMGAVYEALHDEVGKRAAVKVLHGELTKDRKFVSRFFDEARMASKVTHPGLVQIYDFNQLSDGTLYILMEFLQGELLWDRVCKLRTENRSGLPWAQAARIIRQLASALAAVHAGGIVHRDLKPENVFMVPDPDDPAGERAKIIDFGVAKSEDGDGEARRTTSGVALGTPTYMAPEQCEGNASLTDRADVYALGVMLFELLSGMPPFASTSTAALMRQHITRDPPPLPPGLPDALNKIVMDMLGKAAAERPSMNQVKERLDALLQGGAAAQVVSVAAPVVAARTRSPLIIAGVGVVAALVLILSTILLLGHPRGNSGAATPVAPVAAPGDKPPVATAPPASADKPQPPAASGPAVSETQPTAPTSPSAAKEPAEPTRPVKPAEKPAGASKSAKTKKRSGDRFPDRFPDKSKDAAKRNELLAPIN